MSSAILRSRARRRASTRRGRLRWASLLLLTSLLGCSENDQGGDAADLDAGPDDAGESAQDGASELPDSGLTDADAAPPDAGTPAASWAELMADGKAHDSTRPRPGYGALLVATDGPRDYVVESRRDVEPGPFGFPWRTRFRLSAYEGRIELWSFPVEPDDVIGDLAVHPSGEITFALQRFAPDRHAYELVRLSRNGALIGRTPLAEPTTPPATDYAAQDPRPLFRMKSPLGDATSAGWLRLLPAGEGVVLAVLSLVDVPADHMLRTRVVLGLGSYDWQTSSFVERWARVVEGPHAAEPAAWAYDELRWRDQAVRSFLARDDSTGELLIGRAWNNLRCEANRAVFSEFPAEECVLGTVGSAENERLPLAVTRFSALGERIGTRILRTDPDALEQVPFGLAARQGELAVVGAVVRAGSDGTRRTYDAGKLVDYDGYIAFYDAQGVRTRGRDVNLGRGDMLAALRWDEQGIVAVGAAGWDRWLGGMSISRGCDPLLVWLSNDAAQLIPRVVALSDQTRHFQLHDVALRAGAVAGFGFSDAPMTHSADGGNTAAKTFGMLRVELTSE